MENNVKNQVAEELKKLVSELRSKVVEANRLGLSVEITTPKFSPDEGLLVSIYEKTTY